MAERLPNRLPRALTTLIGRERELDDLVALLRRDDVRIVTVSGPGGTGKTRLALEVARVLEAELDSVVFVALANLLDASAVLPAIAQSLGLHDEPGTPLIAVLERELVGNRVLLTLDNMEHVTEAGPEIAALLGNTHSVKVLVTSRAVLHVRGEHEFALDPLPIPNVNQPGAHSELERNPAVALFVERAQAIKSDFQLTRENGAAVAEVCARLDGLPLAIELAAARIRLLSPAAMVPRLSNSLQLLTGGARDLPTRQQTLRSAIAWSVDLLDDEERILFRRLAVFARGCTLEAAESIASGEEPSGSAPDLHTTIPADSVAPLLSVLDGISGLVEHSLLRQVERGDAEPRFEMLGTIREFAGAVLADSGEHATYRDRHLTYFRELAEHGRDELASHQQAEWIARFDSELDNLRAAMAWAIERGDAISAQAIAGALPRYWEIRGNLTEGRAWTDRALAASGDHSRERATALIGAATLARRQGEYAHAISLYEEALAIARELADGSTVASVLNNLGVVAQDQGDYERALQLGEEALGLFRDAGDQVRIAAALNNLGIVARRRGDPERAAALFEESHAIWKDLGDQLRIALALNNLGVAAFEAGDLQRAASCYEDALVVWRERDDRTGAALSLHNLAEVLRDQGDLARATSLWEESLSLRAEQGNVAGFAESLSGLAVIALRSGMLERAVELLGAAEGMQTRIGYQLPPKERDQQERATATLRSRLDAQAFETAWAAGQELTLDEAVVYVRSSAEEAVAAASAAAAREADKSAAATAGLTRRELEVLRLVADGMSDKEIGEALFISHRTAMTHVLNILNKLGVNSRTAAASHALRQGLI
jgi:predicted ATPase/DNA-binding CsgD family transcriptional regulator